MDCSGYFYVLGNTEQCGMHILYVNILCRNLKELFLNNNNNFSLAGSLLFFVVFFSLNADEVPSLCAAGSRD